VRGQDDRQAALFGLLAHGREQAADRVGMQLVLDLIEGEDGSVLGTGERGEVQEPRQEAVGGARRGQSVGWIGGFGPEQEREPAIELNRAHDVGERALGLAQDPLKFAAMNDRRLTPIRQHRP